MRKDAGKTAGKTVLPVFLMLFLLVICIPAYAGTAKSKPKSIKLDQTAVKMITGQTFTLKATISPKSAAKTKITWESSNPEVAVVSSKGKVTLKGVGAAKITAKTENGKKASCKVYSYKYSMKYTISGRKLTVTTPEDTKSYIAYSQLDYGNGYYRDCGCMVTAVSIAASGFGKYYSPVKIHTGPANARYSERYAVTALGKADEMNARYGRKTISLRTGAHILKNMGISCKPVYTFDKATALKEIRAHLQKGKPVIIKANNNTHNGIRLANVHHALVIVGLDSNDHAIIINPGSPTYRTSITLSTLVNYHMTPASGDYSTAYVTGKSMTGGYILIYGLN